MTHLRFLLLATLLSPLALTGCDGGGDDGGDDGPNIDCNESAAPGYSTMSAVWAKCTTCHATDKMGAARGGAPEGYNYDTPEAAKAEAEEAQEQVFNGVMPPAGQPQLTEAEKDMLYRWASCDTPP